MSTFTFENEQQIGEDWVNYILNEANTLARQDDFEIENYADREILNPEVREYLMQLDIPEGVAELEEKLSLSFFEERSSSAQGLLLFRFRNVKRKVRQVLCQILSELEDKGVINWTEIIRTVLLALAGAFFGGAFGAILLPILIAMIARIIRRGIDSVCTIA